MYLVCCSPVSLGTFRMIPNDGCGNNEPIVLLLLSPAAGSALPCKYLDQNKDPGTNNSACRGESGAQRGEIGGGDALLLDERATRATELMATGCRPW